MYLSYVLSLFLFYAVLRFVNSSSRVIRVLEGSPVNGRYTGYNSVRYFVYISNGHECSFKSPNWLRSLLGKSEKWMLDFSVGFACSPNPETTHCGGALLTPRIVQTACHCLADFDPDMTSTFPRRAVVKTHWEGIHKIYVGVNEIAKFPIGIMSKNHYVHMKCVQLGVNPYWATHDFGWILLTDSIETWGDFPLHWIDYAPQYGRSELVRIFLHTIKTQAVCLIIGFGGYKFEFDTFGLNMIEIRSPELRHGWVTSMDQYHCRETTSPKEPYEISHFNFTADATWCCGHPFKAACNIFQRCDLPPNAQGKTDSGGPISCNNQYFGVASQRYDLVKESQGAYLQFISMYGAIYFAQFQNAVEFRAAFMNLISKRLRRLSPNRWPTRKTIIIFNQTFNNGHSAVWHRPAEHLKSTIVSLIVHLIVLRKLITLEPLSLVS